MSIKKGGLWSGTDFRISLWNYCHYRLINFREIGTLAETLQAVKQAGFGIELWNAWRSGTENIKRLYSIQRRPWLRKITRGMRISLHCSTGYDKPAEVKREIDTAAFIGADVLVMHNLLGINQGLENVKLAEEWVQYANRQGVTLALENGQLELLARAAANVAGLKICLDIGHIYATRHGLREFIEALGEKIVHFHFQDVPEIPMKLDHWTLGTGKIPQKDWQYLVRFIRETKYKRAIVFEIRPVCPLVTARQSIEFLNTIKA